MPNEADVIRALKESNEGDSQSLNETREVASRAMLVAAVKRLGIKDILKWDWHEPDQAGITAKVTGKRFDNAGTSGEMMLTIFKDGSPKFQIRLANLMQLAVNPKSTGVSIGWDDVPLDDEEGDGPRGDNFTHYSSRS